MRSITLLGATGSIGASALDVIARHPDRFSVAALAAHSNWRKLLQLCVRFRPACAAIVDTSAARLLEQALVAQRVPTRVVAGPEGLVEVSALPQADTVIASIVGAAGLLPTLAAARAGKRILLANKEALVIGGALFMRAVREGGATLLPIDSEHNAIFQCMPAGYANGSRASGVRRILLTASGGPFRETPLDRLAHVTPDEACAHPNWSMGRKISVDSATMMNKGLEVIEAHWLFDAPRESIDVVLHPQSVIHSLVEYVDGSVLAQLGQPDMRTPIAQALAYPDRVDAGVASLDLPALASLSFSRPDLDRFPCLGLAYAALAGGACAQIVLNAANEIAVEAFLDRRAPFSDIARVCAQALERVASTGIASLDAALAVDEEARRVARGLVGYAADAARARVSPA
jgi:1-deoxy-D-xylulose-5-phosphate reductoisomerase